MRRALLIGIVFAALAPVTAVTPALAGTESIDVTFRLTLSGEVDENDGFFIDVRCSGSEFCRDGEERFVFFCAHPNIVDTVTCGPRSFEFTVAIPPQSLRYSLYRIPDVPDPDHEASVVLAGTFPVNAGSRVLSLGYVYPGAGGSSAPLPDTAMSAP